MAFKQPFPPVPTRLLEELERRFPDVLPPNETTLDELRLKQGEITVVRFLRHQYKLQNTPS